MSGQAGGWEAVLNPDGSGAIHIRICGADPGSLDVKS
jgi:hypothetical protein